MIDIDNMQNLRKVVKSGGMLMQSFKQVGKESWRQPDGLLGFQECKDAMEKITWEDCQKAIGSNCLQIMNQPLATHI